MTIFFACEVVIVVLCVVNIAIICIGIHITKGLNKDIDNLYEDIAKMTIKLKDHTEQIQLLGINTEPEESENEESKSEEQKTLDDRYNEGMDNIFGYTVNTGIRAGDYR